MTNIANSLDIENCFLKGQGYSLSDIEKMLQRYIYGWLVNLSTFLIATELICSLTSVVQFGDFIFYLLRRIEEYKHMDQSAQSIHSNKCEFAFRSSFWPSYNNKSCVRYCCKASCSWCNGRRKWSEHKFQHGFCNRVDIGDARNFDLRLMSKSVAPDNHIKCLLHCGRNCFCIWSYKQWKDTHHACEA